MLLHCSMIFKDFIMIFHASFLSLARRNILFHLILVGGMYLDQVPRCQAINSNNFDLYFLLLSLFQEDLSPVSFSCSHRNCRRNKNKVFEFILLCLKLLTLFVWKVCLIYPNLATHSHTANVQCVKTYSKLVV